MTNLPQHVILSGAKDLRLGARIARHTDPSLRSGWQV